MKENAIFGALTKNDLNLVNKLINENKNMIDSLNKFKKTPLMEAVLNKSLEIVKILVENGCDVNLQDEDGWSALHFAAHDYLEDIVEFLIKNGANIDAQDINGNTPLWRAVFESRGRGGVIKLLLSNNADRNLKNKHGVSPFDLAKTIGNYNIVQFF